MRTETETDRLAAAGQSLSAVDFADVRVGMVLGSGLKDFAQSLTDTDVIPFQSVANWPVPRVAGHGGSLILGVAEGTRVACLDGRVHLYEGWRPSDVVRPVRTLRQKGISTFVLTNAAGGVTKGLAAGDLMLISDHLNLTGDSPLRGAHEDVLGPRFPDQSAVYDAQLRAVLHGIDADLREGVYAGLLGPNYETPAEIRMLSTLGADAVGMSTVHEAMALSAMGAQVVGISLISNLAAGVSPTPLDHREVIAAGNAAGPRFRRLLRAFCQSLAKAKS